MILTSKSHKSENFILSPALAIIPNIQWKIAVMLFSNFAFLKLSSPLGNKLKNIYVCCFLLSLPTHRGKCGARLFCDTPFLTKNIIKSVYQDQFSCYPYKLSKRGAHTWLVPFSSFKMQPTRFHYNIWFQGYSFIADMRMLCHITKTHSKLYSFYYATSIVSFLFVLVKWTK